MDLHPGMDVLESRRTSLIFPARAAARNFSHCELLHADGPVAGSTLRKLEAKSAGVWNKPNVTIPHHRPHWGHILQEGRSCKACVVQVSEEDLSRLLLCLKSLSWRYLR